MNDLDYERSVVTNNEDTVVVGQRYDEEFEVFIFFVRERNGSGMESTDLKDIAEYIMQNKGGLKK